MPWKEQRPVEQRFAFVLAVEKGEHSMAALCRQFGISRQTGYKWWRRYLKDPTPETLQERPAHAWAQPTANRRASRDLVVAARKKYRHWGPRTLHVWLESHMPEQRWPSPATIGRILRRRGLVVAPPLRLALRGGARPAHGRRAPSRRRLLAPASLYAPSVKSPPSKQDHDYYRFAFEHVVVDKHGATMWQGRKHQLVEFRRLRGRRWLVCFGPVQLGIHAEGSRRRGLLPVRARRVATGNAAAS